MERDEVLSRLRAALRDTLAGHGRQVVAVGAAATGKTALLSALAAQSRAAGATVLLATGSRREAGLPYGVIRQLLASGAEDPALASAARFLDGTIALGTMSGPPERADPSLVDRICAEVLRAARSTPLVIAADDVDHADLASVHCLVELGRRLEDHRILLFLAASPGAGGAYAPLIDAPGRQLLPLEPLSVDGVATLLAQHTDGLIDAALATDHHAVSGGNPLLVKALVEDARNSPGGRPGSVVVGDAFTEAVLDCLYQGTPTTLRVARALAVLGDASRPTTLSWLADADADSTRSALDLLTASGLLREGRFRHPAAREVVLRHLIAEEGPEQHRRAAELLHREGAAPAEVARQLVAAGTPPEDWAVPVLREAARQAVVDGDLHGAIDLLELAHTGATEAGDRIGLKVLMSSVEWQLDPSLAARHLEGLAAMARDGGFGPRAGVATAQQLLWHGWVDEAMEVLRHARFTVDDPRTARLLSRSRNLLAYAYPAVGRRLRTLLGDPCAAPAPHAAPDGDPAELLLAAVDGVTGRHRQLERLLEQRYDRLNPVDLTAALIALVCDDRADRAARWAARLAAGRGRRFPPTWQAILAALHGEAARRQGDLRVAAAETERALALVDRDGWGVAVGGPVSTRVLTLVSTGHLDEAAQVVNQPLPPATFQTPFGLHFLHARGRYYAATQRPDAALVDFHTCGELMRVWEVDLPALVPWRTEAARVYLSLGRTAEAARLADEQMRMVGDRRSRSRGLTLLVAAAVSPLPERLPLLREAVDILEEAGDRLALVRALNDEAAAHHAVGNTIQGRMSTRRARQVAEQGGFPGSGRRTHDDGGGTATLRVDAEQVAALSEAERRVATLAAQGLTNREIADQLSVTVSTVEQHLTRVYRKLRVRRRADLPYRLGAASSGPS
ncbi:ATP-binding protein [Micromonospora sp. CA-244673]|uniref:ATP-binding protein n=1 Tax=Micromonospora sp. CA-244673 TaxID=3239958 RepID=UPI003D8A07B0